MASEIQGKRMSDYTPLNELTQQEQVTYLSNAAVTTFGAKENAGPNINVNIPLSTLVPSATDLAGDGLSVNGSTGRLDVSNKVPAPTATTDRGKVLSVATDSDNIVWSTPAVPEISQYNGNVSAINATNDSSSGGYVFDVNLDTDTLEKRHTTGENQVSYIAVKNPVPSTANASDGDVLTYDTSDGIVWAAPQGGGGGGGLPDASKIIGQRTGSGGDYALFVPYCNITRDGDGNVATVGEIKWLWADVISFADGYKPIPE